MSSCPSCSAENSEESHFCSECGSALSPEYEPTKIPDSGDRPQLLSSVSNFHHGSFVPGAIVADRYRIVSLVGKGGMGEVYRADDLKLGHTVALKFLPKDLAENEQRLEYFHSEVRLTRQISHPNVCRVYDIGEVDGLHFLSMEYIDGEDLQVLLRRIGRLPQEKGIQIAQQLCAGLAAAHDNGVLHRDLKPANVMLDSRGQVRITDFGLAKLMDEGNAGEIAGTPAYMAPEQLLRGDATIQSDLFSLGLILYEIFTGERARKSGSIPELIQVNEESSLAQTLELPIEIDSAVQRAILRCLEREPHDRPLSANAVAASLPGSDPLAAALAAGETPSPELVAAGGESGLLSLKNATILLATTLVTLAILIWMRGARSPTIGLEVSAADYAAQSRQILEELGLSTRNSNAWFEAYKFGLRIDVTSESMARAEDISPEFWYRRSPVRMHPEDDAHSMLQSPRVTLKNPPSVTDGMMALRLNQEKQLRELFVVPSLEHKNTSELSSLTDDELWEIAKPFLAKAGFDQSQGDGVKSYWQIKRHEPLTGVLPPIPCDVFFVLMPTVDLSSYAENNFDQIGSVTFALVGEKVVYFNVIDKSLKPDDMLPWRHAVAPQQGSDEKPKTPDENFLRRLSTQTEFLTGCVSWAISLLILPVTMILAWRNVILGRSDRKTAWRVAVFLFFITLVKTRLYAGFHLELLRASIQLSVGKAFQIWIYYHALEPIMRKFWPGILTAWSRAMTGRWRDPSLGQGLLLGMVMGVTVQLFNVSLRGVAVAASVNPAALSSMGGMLATMLGVIQFISGWGLYITIVLVLCRLVTRNNWGAALLAIVLNMIFHQFDFLVDPDPFTIVFILYYAVVTVFLIRFGVVAAFSFLFCNHLLESLPTSHDQFGPDFPPTILAILTVTIIAVYGFYTSVGGRPAFERKSL